MNLRPDDFRPGERLAASELNAMRAELQRLGRISFVAPIGGASDGAGIAIWEDRMFEGWIKLTGGGMGGEYDWTAQVAVAGGDWEDDPGGLGGTHGDDGAFEVNANASITLSPEPIVWAWRARETGEIRFSLGNCS